jgi:hypothetical protein
MPASAATVSASMVCTSDVFGVTYEDLTTVTIDTAAPATIDAGTTLEPVVSFPAGVPGLPVAVTGAQVQLEVTVTEDSPIGTIPRQSSGTVSATTDLIANAPVPAPVPAAISTPTNALLPGQTVTYTLAEFTLTYVAAGDGLAGTETTCVPFAAAPLLATVTITGVGRNAQVAAASGQATGVVTAARPGATLSMTGSNFPGDLTVGAFASDLCTDAACSSPVSTTNALTTTSAGLLQGDLEIPSGQTPGTYLIRLTLAGASLYVSAVPGSSAAAPFTVLGAPTLTLTPTQGGAGQPVTASGAGWNPTTPSGPATELLAEKASGGSGTNTPVPFEVGATGLFTAEVVAADPLTTQVIARQWPGVSTSGAPDRIVAQPFTVLDGACVVAAVTSNGSDPNFDPAVDQNYGSGTCSFPLTLFAQVRAGEFKVETISVSAGNGTINKGTGAIIDANVRGQINFYKNTIPPAFTGVPNDRVLTTFPVGFAENTPAGAKVNSSITAQEMVAKLNPLRVTDARGTNNGAQLTASVTTFATAFDTSGTLPAGSPAAGASTIALSNLKVYSTCAPTTAGVNQGTVGTTAGVNNGVTIVSSVPYPNAPTFVTFAASSGNANVSNPVTLCGINNEPVGVGAGGQWDVNTDLNLTVPAFQNRGNYTATMTITLL